MTTIWLHTSTFPRLFSTKDFIPSKDANEIGTLQTLDLNDLSL